MYTARFTALGNGQPKLFYCLNDPKIIPFNEFENEQAVGQ